MAQVRLAHAPKHVIQRLKGARRDLSPSNRPGRPQRPSLVQHELLQVDVKVGMNQDIRVRQDHVVRLVVMRSALQQVADEG